MAVAMAAILAGGWIMWSARRLPDVPTVVVPPSPGPRARSHQHADSKPPGFDRRETGAGVREKAVQAARKERRQAAVRLQEEMPLVRVDFDERLGSPRYIGSPTRFLTGADGAVPPERITKTFISEHAALFGHGADLLDDALVSRDYVTPHNGLRTMVWQQAIDGLRVFESTLQANITAKGELVNIASRFVPDARAAAETGTPEAPRTLSQPPVDAPRAISVAAATVGDSVPREQVAAAGPPAGVSRKQKFSAPALLDLSAEYVWLPLDESAMRLCWEVIFTSRARGEMFRTLVDAVTGDALVQQGLTEYISPASYRVFTSDSPSPIHRVTRRR